MKLCFVTVGATASFEKLLKAVLTSEFLETLAERQYTHLLIQYGYDGKEIFNDFLDSGTSCHGITLGGFGFKPSIERDMIMTTEREDQKRGLIISHAGMTFYFDDRSMVSVYPDRHLNVLLGSGSVLAGLRLGVPLIVVPNPDLSDNHQQELADGLERQNYVISSTVEWVISIYGFHAWPDWLTAD